MRKILAFIIILLSTEAFSFDLGAGVHFNEKDDNTIQLLSSLGMNSFRTDFPWQLVENEKGKYKLRGRLKSIDLAINEGLKKKITPLLILDYGNTNYTDGSYPESDDQIKAFADYSGWVANKYKGRVETYEIWNEWLAGTGLKKHKTPPPPEVFIKLIKETSKRIRNIDPNAKIIAGGASVIKPDDLVWMNKLIDLGVQKYIDGISIHNYNYHEKNITNRDVEYSVQSIIKFENEIKKIQVELYHYI
ncbi:cellulase family glycosylhydrolase [Tatumella morbirosei]|uniref:cellulase family glycosylhydrolase n=1 Tax=Tatumella morbirosei TaxID=642227 RepID=UPI00069C4C9E|nr:cellulase family glycosylhydrolase [Tatumella morbirosei]